MKMVETYAQPITHESERYHPFVTLANHVLGGLRKALGAVTSFVTLCRNDPMYIRGSDADRKPDNAIVDVDAAQKGARISVDNMSKEGPAEEPFSWWELLGFCEHKQVKHALRFSCNSALLPL